MYGKCYIFLNNDNLLSLIVYFGDISYVVYLVHWPVVVMWKSYWDIIDLACTGPIFPDYIWKKSISRHHYLYCNYPSNINICSSYAGAIVYQVRLHFWFHNHSIQHVYWSCPCRRGCRLLVHVLRSSIPYSTKIERSHGSTKWEFIIRNKENEIIFAVPVDLASAIKWNQMESHPPTYRERPFKVRE